MKIIGIFFVVASAILGVLAAIDEYMETSAQMETPPVAYVSPSYIPPYSDMLWCVALVIGVLCLRYSSVKAGQKG